MWNRCCMQINEETGNRRPVMLSLPTGDEAQKAIEGSKDTVLEGASTSEQGKLEAMLNKYDFVLPLLVSYCVSPGSL